MYIYLDESGDLGFDFRTKHPSTFFVITLLACNDKKIVDCFHSAVKKTLKNKINHKKKTKAIKHELKASQTLQHVKEYYYNQVIKQISSGWSLYSIILNKKRLLQRVTTFPEPKQLYNVLARKALERINFNHNPDSVELIIDKSKTTKEITIFNEYLSNHLAANLPLQTKLTINHIASLKNTGLQSVDMFSWGIYRKYESNDLDWYKLFCSQIAAEEQI